jgi:hypothetical protein
MDKQRPHTRTHIGECPAMRAQDGCGASKHVPVFPPVAAAGKDLKMVGRAQGRCHGSKEGALVVGDQGAVEGGEGAVEVHDGCAIYGRVRHKLSSHEAEDIGRDEAHVGVANEWSIDDGRAVVSKERRALSFMHT